MQDLCVIVGRGNRSTKLKVAARAKQETSSNPATENAANTASAFGLDPTGEVPGESSRDTAEELIPEHIASTETAADIESATASGDKQKRPRRADNDAHHIGSTICQFLQVSSPAIDLPGSLP